MQTNRTELVARLEEIYRSRYRQFLRVAIGVISDEDEAHDAVQEGFARALRRIGGFTGGGTFEGWLWRVVTNEVLSHASRNVPIPIEMDEAPVLQMPAIGEDSVVVWIRRLPIRQRLVLFLRYYADLDYRSIAEALQIEVGTVSATLSTAHAALRSSLKEVER
jgi:RNA polymerase sigma-70 factor (ECF subfamily)